jgi:hypothetical protein
LIAVNVRGVDGVHGVPIAVFSAFEENGGATGAAKLGGGNARGP